MYQSPGNDRRRLSEKEREENMDSGNLRRSTGAAEESWPFS